ncbi:MAG TPA: copper amine oxidase N-terminal domain-containing protein [Candidatus Acidoferrales bacterium]|nr:copper amine oxidase N-terminal domain-containing protein [Candidatus Acidoferrales bacterium]
MKRLSTGVLAVLLAAGLGLNAVAAQNTSASHGNIGTNAIAQDSGSTMAPPANFGSPPSGQIPILYNDHHVYAKPDVLKQGRVLAALVRGGTVLIPLRSMFEQMGATVSYDASSKTVDVSKPGADVKVTVGKPEVVINGESRPLDVPPILYHGHVLVPVRVISEGMGAYVQWVPDKQLVVVRYIPPTPPPTPTPPPPPTAPPATAPPTPTPAPVATPYRDLFIAGDYLVSQKVYDEFSPGNTASGNNGNGISYQIHGAGEFDVFGMPWMIDGALEQINYPHDCGIDPTTGAYSANCYVTTIGGMGSNPIGATGISSYEAEAHVGLKVADPHIYIGVGYLWRSNNVGYPRLSNVGFGAEKLPDLNHPFSVYGSVWYYGNVKGNFTDPSGNVYQLAYNILKGQLGVTYSFQGSPLFLEAAVIGEELKNKTNAPSDGGNFGPYVGIGLKF